MQKQVDAPDVEGDVLADHLGQEGQGFDFVNFLRVVRMRWKLLAATVAAVVALALAFIALTTPLYSATAIVMLDQQKNSVESADAILSGLGSDQATIQNQVQILTSQELANRVIDKLKLDQDPEFNPATAGWAAIFGILNPMNWFPKHADTQAAAQGQDLERASLIARFESRLSIEPIGLSTAISITFASSDPQKAALITNAIANAYVEDQLEAKFDATQKATQWLSGRIAELARKAQEADAAVQRYKAEHNITTTGNGVSVIDQQTSDINAQLVASKTVLAEKQAAYSSLLGLARAGRAADSAAAMASPVISALRAQESDIARQLADLSSKYLPGHPKILDLEAQKANIEAKINVEVQRIVDAAHNDVVIASAHVASLQSSLGSLEHLGASQNEAAVELTALESAATSARSLYEAFLGRFNKTQGQEGILTPDSRVISKATVPTSPSFPKKPLVIGIAIPGGLILALMLAFFLERLNVGFRTAAQVESVLGLPVLATVPEVVTNAKDSASALDQVTERPMSSFAEAVRGLQFGISLANVDRQPKVIVVTSSVPGEGKTTVALSLARAAAKGGKKTIIIDGDLRRPNVAKALGKDNFEHSLVDILSGRVSLDQGVVKDPKSDVVVLGSLKTPPNPADLLGSQAMRDLVSTLSRAFDLVIIDSAPILPVNDTKALSRLADAVLFVVRWETTPREAAVHAVRALSDVHAPFCGVALTRADSERFRYYSYGYQSYYNYNRYYS
jgi:exopolysaccharide transport family protein